MPILYINNFRGFKETYLPLQKVNFLVGENSTGKTSILKLIEILSNSRFWFLQDFNLNDYTELGYFNEIANINAKYFEIGIMRDNSSNSAIKLKFIEHEGMPRISELNFINEKINLNARISLKDIKYRYKKIPKSKVTTNESNETKLNYFKEWILNNGFSTEAFQTISNEKHIRSDISLWHIQNFIARDMAKKNDINEDALERMGLPSFLNDVAWIAPIRAEPKKTYDSYKISFSPTGSHAPYLLKSLLSDKNKDKVKIEEIFNQFGKESGLFEKVEIHPLGEDKTSPFEITIVLNNNSYKINNVGYGVSQILPLLVEILARTKDTWFAIQQPEIHIHPRGQAAFGEFIYKIYKEENKRFIIETHSDFTIDRFRLNVNKRTKEKINKNEFQVIFFERSNNNNKLTCIPINSDGSYGENQPKAFKEFFIKEQLELLRM